VEKPTQDKINAGKRVTGIHQGGPVRTCVALADITAA
jgi:hypothetical protein